MPTATFAAARSPFDGNSFQPVGPADLAVWRQYFGQSLPTTTAVPEPSAASLGAIAALGLVGWLRRAA